MEPVSPPPKTINTLKLNEKPVFSLNENKSQIKHKNYLKLQCLKKMQMLNICTLVYILTR